MSPSSSFSWVWILGILIPVATIASNAPCQTEGGFFQDSSVTSYAGLPSTTLNAYFQLELPLDVTLDQTILNMARQELTNVLVATFFEKCRETNRSSADTSENLQSIEIDLVQQPQSRKVPCVWEDDEANTNSGSGSSSSLVHCYQLPAYIFAVGAHKPSNMAVSSIQLQFAVRRAVMEHSPLTLSDESGQVRATLRYHQANWWNDDEQLSYSTTTDTRSSRYPTISILALVCSILVVAVAVLLRRFKIPLAKRAQEISQRSLQQIPVEREAPSKPDIEHDLDETDNSECFSDDEDEEIGACQLSPNRHTK